MINLKKNSTRAIFLDRDGVINQNRDNYVKSIDEFILLPDVPKAINLLNQRGYKIIIITNQSAINRGIITEHQLSQIHEYMLNILRSHECRIHRIYYCPHRPDENCQCRKPQSGLIKKAIEDFNINVKDSWLIGDSDSDIQAAKELNLKSIKIERNGDLMLAAKIIADQSY